MTLKAQEEAAARPTRFTEMMPDCTYRRNDAATRSKTKGHLRDMGIPNDITEIAVNHALKGIAADAKVSQGGELCRRNCESSIWTRCRRSCLFDLFGLAQRPFGTLVHSSVGTNTHIKGPLLPKQSRPALVSR